MVCWSITDEEETRSDKDVVLQTKAENILDRDSCKFRDIMRTDGLENLMHTRCIEGTRDREKQRATSLCEQMAKKASCFE